MKEGWVLGFCLNITGKGSVLLEHEPEILGKVFLVAISESLKSKRGATVQPTNKMA